MIIAIDGPGASGKSTTAKYLSKAFNLIYLDTGAMYRAVAFYINENSPLPPSESGGITEKALLEISDFSFLDNIEIEFFSINEENRIYLNGNDITEGIRNPKITKLSSIVATIKEVRQKLVAEQRRLSENRSVILDGRDIGTVVFPDADYKFFLTASLDVRATRRYEELIERGMKVSFEDIKEELSWRDKNDCERLEAPLRKADDAIEIDTSTLSIQQQVNVIIELINKQIRE